MALQTIPSFQVNVDHNAKREDQQITSLNCTNDVHRPEMKICKQVGVGTVLLACNGISSDVAVWSL